MAGDVFKLFGSIGLKTEEAEKGLKDVVGEAETTGNNLTSIFKKAALAIGAMFAAGKLIDFGKMTVNAAAEAEEFAGAFEQVFKGFESQAEASMANVTDTIKASEGRFKESFLQISGFGKASGMDTEESIDLSNRAIIAAADYAAMYGGTLEDTAGSLQSFLKGNYANDAALGVSATEFTRNAAAVELYGAEFNELTETQKQWVLLDMVEKANETSGAMGQAAREVDSYANTMGELKNAWNEFLIIVGGPILKAVVPIIKGITQGVQWLTEAIVPAAEAVGKFFDGFKSSSGEIRKLISREFKQLMQWFDDFVSIFKEIDFELLLENLIEFGQGAIEVFMEIAEGVLEFLEPIQTYWENVIDIIQNLFKGLVRSFNQAMRGDWSGAFDTLKTAIGDALIAMGDNILEAWSGIWDNVKELASSIDWLGVAESIMSTLGSAISGAIGFLGDIGATIKSWISEKLGLGEDGSWGEIGRTILDNITTGVVNAFATAGNIGKEIIKWISNKLSESGDTDWLTVGKNILNNIIEVMGSLGQSFGLMVRALISGINELMTAEQFNGLVRSFLSFIVTAIAGAVTGLLAIAIALINGITLGLLGANNWGEVKDAIFTKIQGVLEGQKMDIDWLSVFNMRPEDWDWSNTIWPHIGEWMGNTFFPEQMVDGQSNYQLQHQFNEQNKNFQPSTDNDRGGGGRQNSTGTSSRTSWFSPKTASAASDGGRNFQTQTPTIDTSAVDKLIADVTAKVNAAIATIEELGRNYTAKLIDGMTKGITTNQSKVILNIGILGNQMKSEFDKIHNNAIKSIETGMNKVQIAYRSGLLKAYATVRDNLTRITEAFRSQVGAVTRAGEDTGRGFYNGLASQQSRIIALARNIAQSVTNTMERALDINSPSGKTEWIGDMTIDGLYNRMQAGISRIKEVTGQVADATLFDPQVSTFDYSATGSRNGQNGTDDLTLIRILSDTNEKLDQIIFKETDLFMNGRKMTEELDEPMNNYRRTQEILRSRQGGTWA